MSLIRRTQIEEIIGKISDNNSTTTPLVSGGIFTGEPDKVSGFKAVGVTAIASHDSLLDGVSMQFSTDGINWDVSQEFTLTAGDFIFAQLPIQSKWFRLVFTNGSINQTYFRVQTILHPTATIGSTLRVDDRIKSQTPAQLTRSVIAGQCIEGHFHNVGTTRQARLKVSSLEVSEGKEWTYTNFSHWNAYEVKTFLLVTPPSAAEIDFSLAFETNGEYPYEIRYYEDTITSHDGVDVDVIPGQPGVINRNRNINDSSKQFGVYASPTVTTSGALMTVHRPPVGGRATSAVANKPNSFVFKPDSKYLVRMKNLSPSGSIITWVADFTEAVIDEHF